MKLFKRAISALAVLAMVMGLFSSIPVIYAQPNEGGQEQPTTVSATLGQTPVFDGLTLRMRGDTAWNETPTAGEKDGVGYWMLEPKADDKQNSFYLFGYVDDEGYIFITGRKKNVIILANGKNIYPEELEEYLYKLDVINECVVVAREVGGETLLTAVVYPEYTRFEGADAEQIKETIKAEIMAVNKHLPVFKQIRNIEIKKNEFEKTTSKKIIRYKV